MVIKSAKDKPIEDVHKLETSLKLLCNAYYFVLYCEKIAKRWKYAEPYIARSAYATQYATNVIHGRFEEYENYLLSQLKSDPDLVEKCFNYAATQQWRWSKLEEYINQNSNQLTDYLYPYSVAGYISKTVPKGESILGALAISAARLMVNITNDYIINTHSLAIILTTREEVAKAYTGS